MGNTTEPDRQPTSTTAGFDLLARLRLREQDALKSLTVQYASALTRAAYVYLGDAHAAEDAAQNTLIAAWDAAKRTRAETPVRPWLFGILFNQCRKHQRSIWRRFKREKAVAKQDIYSDGETNDDEQKLETLRRAVGRLDEPLRAVIVLRFEQQMSVAETAQALSLPEGTVKSRTHTAVTKLRQQMKGQ